MKQYEVNKTLFLQTGRVMLTPEQAKHRMHALRPALGDDGKAIPGVFDIVKEVCFKAGEKITLDGVPNKALASELLPPEELAALQRKADADARAAAKAESARIAKAAKEKEARLAEEAKAADEAKAKAEAEAKAKAEADKGKGGK